MVDFRIYDVTVSGTVSEDSLSNLIIGGAMVPTDLENMLVALIPIIGGGVNYQDHLSAVADVLTDLFVGSFCSRMSVGLLGSWDAGPQLSHTQNHEGDYSVPVSEKLMPPRSGVIPSDTVMRGALSRWLSSV
jgi:hypothetical protein